MRGLPLLVATLVASLVLSGCLQGLLPNQGAPAASAEQGPEWFELPLPSALPVSGLLAVWVPTGTLGLRMATIDANDTAPYFDPGAWDARSSRYPAMPQMLVVRAPDETILTAGSDTGHHATGAMRVDPNIFLDLRDPTPGLYVIALFGDHLPPRVALELPNHDTPAYPILPLGIGYARHLLVTTDHDLGMIDHAGTLRGPPHTVRADVDLRGYGTDARIALANDEGASISTHEAIVAQRPGEEQQVPLILTGPVLRTYQSHPAATTPGTWDWDATLSGTGTAFAWTGQSIDLPPPVPLPRTTPPGETLNADHATERIPLAGAIRPGEAAWVTMPDDARLHPLFDSYGDSYYNGQPFRVYDQDGQRLAWDLVPDDARAYPLPAGPLLIVNDGARDLRIEILDAVPIDASLHMARTESTHVNLDAPIIGGYWEASTSAFLPGPVSGLVATHYGGQFTDLSISVRGVDGRVAAQLPRVGYDGPAFPYYCCTLFTAGQTVDLTPWLDGGRYRITASAAGLDLDAVTWVLDGGVDPDGTPNPVPNA